MLSTIFDFIVRFPFCVGYKVLVVYVSVGVVSIASVFNSSVYDYALVAMMNPKEMHDWPNSEDSGYL